MAAVLIVTQTEATVDSLFKDTYKIQSTEATSNLIFICMNFFQKNQLDKPATTLTQSS